MLVKLNFMAWYNIFRKSGEPEQAVADEFDFLAAIVRFASIKERSSAFYQKHRLVVDQALEFVHTLRAESRDLGFMLTGSGVPVANVAQTVRGRIGGLSLSPKAQECVETGARDVVTKFGPILADLSRPAYLDECKWIVKSACDTSRPVLAEAGAD